LRLAVYLGLRHLKQRRSRLLSSAAWAGLGSVSLGVTAMITSMALMSGYTETLLEKMLMGGALIVIPIGQPNGIEELPDRLEAMPAVAAVQRSLLVQGSLQPLTGRQSDAVSVDVHLRGVDSRSVGPLGSGSLALLAHEGPPGVRLGQDLAQRLGVEVGDRVRLVALDLQRGARFRYRTLAVVEIFRTGFALFDREYAVLRIEELERLTGGLPFFEVVTHSARGLDDLRDTLEADLGDDYLVRDWRQSSPGLFTALRVQKWALFLLLGLIVVVSTFNVAAALLVLIRERTREIGVLLALGTPPRALRWSFLLSGLLLGIGGCLLGAACGGFIAWLTTTFELLRFDPGVAEIYFVDRIPLRLRMYDLSAVVLFTLLVTVVACWWPLQGLRRISPARALRFE
jgi:lipoprotein-releasing system permease protein